MKNKLSLLVLLSALLVGLFALAQTGSKVYAAEGHASCMKECQACVDSCEQALTVAKKNKTTDAAGALEDCIQMCKTSHDFMSRGSAMHNRVCGVCADVCKKCAEACDKQKDKVYKDCAEECRKCASSCEKMAS